MHYIFVYGTLKKGFGNHRYFLNKEPLHYARLEVFIVLEGGRGFPAIKQGDGFVEGEVYEVNDDALRQLDSLESHPRFYRRTPVQVITSNKDVMEVETYVIVNASTWREYGKSNWE